MNQYKKEILSALKILKANYNITSVKAEFESEGASFTEALLLKELAKEAGLDFTIKIGGCGAARDLRDAVKLKADTIVAPMIESSYAAEKFINSTETVFSEKERKNIKLLINIETIQGFNCLDEILNSTFADKISGIVVGRTDFACSLGLDREKTDDKQIFEFTNLIAQKTVKHNKGLIIGGGVTSTSIEFFKNLPKNSLTRFETRKIIFDASILIDKNADKGILKAIDFEVLWLKYKHKLLKTSHKDDKARLKTLTERLGRQNL